MTEKKQELLTLLADLEYALKDARLFISQAESCLVNFNELLEDSDVTEF